MGWCGTTSDHCNKESQCIAINDSYSDTDYNAPEPDDSDGDSAWSSDGHDSISENMSLSDDELAEV